MERGGVRAGPDRRLTVATEAATTIRCFTLRLALPGRQGTPSGVPRRMFAAAQGIVFGLLRQADAIAATTLHDADERKALSVGPVEVRGAGPGMARAEVRLCAWEPGLTALVAAALETAAAARLDLGGVPAVVLDWSPAEAWTVADLLATPAIDPVRVRFASPTRFGFGRHPNGAPRTHLVPDPGPVVASWLRAWRLTGDRSLAWLPAMPEELGRAVALTDARELRTVGVVERGVPLLGFVGECAYRWQGVEPAGRRALALLARFATVCGTGAKTGRGFGRTVLVGAVGGGGEGRGG